MTIEWVLPGATPEQKAVALEAALVVFRSKRIQPEIAAFACQEMNVYLTRGQRGPLPHPQSAEGAQIFQQARDAAVRAAQAAGASMEELTRGHIRADIDDGTLAGQFMRESRVLNWVDPEAPTTAS